MQLYYFSEDKNYAYQCIFLCVYTTTNYYLVSFTLSLKKFLQYF